MSPRPSPLRPVRGVVPAALVGALSTASGVALTATSGWLIVRADQRPYILALMVAIVSVRMYGMARPALRYAERLLSHNAALADLVGRRVEAYAALVPLTPARLGRRNRSALLTGVVRDLDDEVDAQLRVLVPLVGSVLTAVGAVVFGLLVLPKVGLVLAAMVLLGVVAAWADDLLERTGQVDTLSARAAVAQATSLVTGSCSELQATGAQAAALRRLDDAQAELERAITRQGRGRAVGIALATLAVGAGTIGTALVVLDALRSGQVSTPMAALLALLPIALNDAFTAVPDALGAWARARGAHARLEDLLEQTPAVAAAVRPSGELILEATEASSPASGIPALDLHDVTASWVEGRADLPATTTGFAPGTTTAIVGANGSGKSTLLAVIARHLDPSGGRYAVDGDDALVLPLADVRANFAIMDDEPHLFASTLRENLRLARPDADDLDLVAALDRSGLRDWYAALPAGLDTILGAAGRGVSGGERARLALARALLSGRGVLLLDEPVAHLDHATAEQVLGDVLAAGDGRTVIVVSHRDDGLAGVDRTLRLGASV